MTLPDPPAFLLRNTQKENTMTTTATPIAPTKPRQPRKDAYCATVKIRIPLNMADATSLAKAIEAVTAIEDTLPEGSDFHITAGLGKI